jgi:hypothetical protein
MENEDLEAVNVDEKDLIDVNSNTSIEKSASEDIEKLDEAMYGSNWVGWNATSFDELKKVSQMVDVVDNFGKLSIIANHMAMNISTMPVNSEDERIEAYTKLIDDFSNLAKELITESKTSNKSIIDKIKTLFKKETKASKADYAYTPGDDPSKWKLPLVDDSGKMTVEKLGQAASAFSPGGHRGNKVKMPAGDVAAAKRKIRAGYAKLGVKPEDIPDSVKEAGNMMVWKEANGVYRVLITYSNCYRDSDNPPEIISSDSHKGFVDMVDNKIADYPDLWHWHIKGTKYGEIDWLAYDEENGFAMACGHILPGHEKEAEALSQMDDLRVSHGMLVLERDPDDDTVITRHITKEISDLPSWAAANKLTSFEIIDQSSEEKMIPDKKKEYLRKLNLTDEQIDEIERLNKERADMAKNEGIEFKEADGDVAEANVDTLDNVSDDKPIADKEPKESKDQNDSTEVNDNKDENTPVTTNDLLGILSAMKSISDAVKTLSEQVESIKSQKENDRELDLSTAASIASLISRDMSAIGSKETSVHKGNKIVDDKPEETKSLGNTQYSNNPVVNSVLSSIIK